MARDIFYEFDCYRLDVAHGVLLCRDNAIALDPQTCEVLRVFVNNPQTVLSIDFLIQQAWEGESTTSNEALSYQISTLRRKLGDDVRNPRFIKTYWKKGFEFLPEVRKIGLRGHAAEFYEKGRHFFNKATALDLTKGIEYYERVIALKGDYIADAYAGIAESCVLLGSFAHQDAPAKEAMGKAKAAASEALALDPDNADAHAALASVAALHEWDWETAREHFGKALTLPGNPLVKPMVRAWYATCLAGRGEFESARDEIDRARADHPNSAVLAALSGRVAYLARDVATAVSECDEAIALEKYFYLGHVFKGHALRLAGEYGEAMKSFSRACELYENNPVCLGEIAHLHGLERREDDARTILDQLYVMAKARYVSPHVFAHIYVGLGDAENALDFLVKTFEEREAWLVFLSTDPAYDSLRGHRRFSVLVHE